MSNSGRAIPLATMSRRPSLSSFKLTTLRAIVGCGDVEIENAVMRRIRKDYADNMPLRVRAAEIVRSVVHRNGSTKFPRDEDELFQITIDALARHGQDHVRCTSLFWEQFFAEADAKTISAEDRRVGNIVRHLLDGRPLFGVLNASSWSYYSFLGTDDVARLRDFIRADARLSKAFDADIALTWLDETCAAGLDVWSWVS